MRTEVLIALIASLTSLLVAIASLVSSTINNRQKSRLELENKFFIEYLNAIGVMVKDIQRLKDMIQLIISARGTDTSCSAVTEDVIKLREVIFNSYEDTIRTLEEEGKGIAHQAKNKAHEFEISLRYMLEGLKYTSEITNENKQNLITLRNEFSDLQNLLRDERIATMARIGIRL